jgi:hypothetical protein
MSTLDSSRLYRLSKSSTDLVQLLSPDISNANIQVLAVKSGNQKAFNRELANKGIEISGAKYEELDSALKRIHDDFLSLKEREKKTKRTRLDFDIAKIVHKNLDLPRSAMVNYDFWQCITLNHFIEIVKWRWEDTKGDEATLDNAKAIFGRALGVTFNKQKYDEDKSITYTARYQRVNTYRYWWIGNRLFDSAKKYYYLDKISEKFKTEEASIQDFLNHLEGNKLLSPNDRLSKIMADCLLLSGRKFNEQEARDCFMRYNAYTSRLFMDADEKYIRKEICHLEV